jgi:thioredoxin-like negative regulator of GroEL
MPPAERSQRRPPVALLAVTTLLFAARLAVPQPGGRVAWLAMEASALAVASGRPLLYYFTADWCGPCHQMSREVFSDIMLARDIETRTVPVRVVDRQLEEGHNPPEVAALQTRFGIQSVPCLVLADPEGRLIARLDGGQSRRTVQEFLYTHTRR